MQQRDGSRLIRRSYVHDTAARPDAVTEAHPLLVVWVLSLVQDVLVALVVGTLVQDPAPTLHPDGVAAAEVAVQVWAVAAAFMAVALEILLLVEHNLKRSGWGDRPW